MTSTNDIAVLPHQYDFITSGAIHTGLVAGFGSGKSIAGTIKIISKKLNYPGIDVAYYLPTHGLLKSIAVPNISEWLAKMEIPYAYHETDKEFTTAYGKIILRSMNNPETIVGYEVGYSIIDEADLLKKDKMRTVFVKILGRNRSRLPDGQPNCVDMISTPEGFNFMYEFFVKDGDKKGRVMIKAKTSDNHHLPITFIETLMEVYNEQELSAYLNGEFVNLTAGTVHHTFNRELNHTDREIKPMEALHIGMDFNVTNMHAVVHVTDGPIIKAVDEIVKAYDTADMIELIKLRFSGHRIVVYPDASGDNRKTAASDTDISLLKKARFKVVTDASNPRVKDRITAMNSGFRNAKGQSDYLVNTFNCPTYTEALEKLPYKNGQPDKESGYDHICEAGGYCYYKMKKPSFTRMYANV